MRRMKRKSSLKARYDFLTLDRYNLLYGFLSATPSDRHRCTAS